MSAVDEILSQIPMNQLAGQLGVDTETAEQASRQALPALLAGIQANTDDPGGASSFAQAVEQHDGGLVEGGVDLEQVDAHDGDKIVSHVFGPNRDQVVDRLGALGGGAGGGGAGQDLIAKLLPILAPIVMAWLSKKLSGPGPGPGRAGRAGGRRRRRQPDRRHPRWDPGQRARRRYLRRSGRRSRWTGWRPR